MLRQLTDAVLVRQSAFCLSNAVVVRGPSGVLVVDPGVHGEELSALADELDELGAPVVAGFSTHPHWDHLLWHPRYGEVPRWATPTAARVAAERRDDAVEKAGRLAPGAPLDLVGRIVPLEASTVPWDGPEVQVIAHRAHAPGHAALLVDGVLVAGDLLSDVEVPLLDLSAEDPVGDHLAAYERIEAAAADTLVPGHGAIASAAQIPGRFAADRAYLEQLRRGAVPEDPRVADDATYGRDWLPAEHQQQVRAVLGR